MLVRLEVQACLQCWRLGRSLRPGLAQYCVFPHPPTQGVEDLVAILSPQVSLAIILVKVYAHALGVESPKLDLN